MSDTDYDKGDETLKAYFEKTLRNLTDDYQSKLDAQTIELKTELGKVRERFIEYDKRIYKTEMETNANNIRIDAQEKLSTAFYDKQKAEEHAALMRENEKTTKKNWWTDIINTIITASSVFLAVLIATHFFH